MGLFSDKKIISVASTLYNMAGDEDERPDFLKGSIYGAVIADSPSIAEEIIGAHFNGTGMGQRQFFRWSVRQSSPLVPEATVQNNIPLDGGVIAGEIPVSPTPAGLIADVMKAELLDGDFEPFIEQWILNNYPTRINENWLGEYDSDTLIFSVQFPNGDFFSWVNTGEFDPEKKYISARYVEYLPESDGSIVTGTTNSITTLPDLTGFTRTSFSDTSTAITLTRSRTTIYSYNNGDPDEVIENGVSANVTGSLSTATEVWERTVFTSEVENIQYGERQIWNFTGTDHVTNDYYNQVVTTTDMGGGVIRTETSTTTGEQSNIRWDSRYDTQQVIIGWDIINSDLIYIYEVGSGNTVLDNIVNEVNFSGFKEFFPVIPVRIKNKSITNDIYSDPDSPTAGNGLYNEARKTYRKAFNYKSFNNLIDEVEANPDIDDIDYAYIMYGTSLNVKENACKKYIFKFMENMIPFQNGGSGNVMSTLYANKLTYDEELAAYDEWNSTNWSSTPWVAIPPPPTIPNLTPPEINVIKVKTDISSFDMRLNWIHTEIDQFSGKYDSDPDLAAPIINTPKIGDLHLCEGTSYVYTEEVRRLGSDDTSIITNTIPLLYIYWQVSENQYRRMSIWGFVHENYVYKGKSVNINSTEALNDINESGFIIPLHYPTMSEMNIVDYTQMATANVHIIFNSYKIVTQRWYEKLIFKIIFVALIIAVAVVALPGTFAAGTGILGTNISIGVALGLTGTAAIVAGTVANYIASIIVAQVLSTGSSAIFGEKWGSVIASLAGFALSMGVSNVSLFSTEGILGLGNAIANGYSGYVQGEISELQDDFDEDREKYEERMEYIESLMENLGGNNLNFNPFFLTDTSYGNGRRKGDKGYLPETLDEYINRTTMTGTDVVELTHAMVYNFVDVQKTLPRN